MFQSFINPNTMNDFSQGNIGAMGFSNVGDNKAQLFIYSPHSMPDQVLRSFVYQFDPGFVDALSSSPQLSLEMAVTGDRAKAIPGATTAIMPDAEGKVADVSNWSNFWTFTLILDLRQASYNGIIAPSSRKIATGYFYGGEPGTTDFAGNFVLNPNVVMVFTHVTNLSVKSNVSRSTPDGMIVYPNTKDYAGEAIPAMYNEDMFIGAPRDLVHNAFREEGSLVNYNDLSLSRVRDGSGTRTIENELKSPKEQLVRIMKAVDIGLEHTQLATPVYDRMTTADEYMQPVDRALDSIEQNLPSSQVLDIVTGLDTSRPISMGELTAMYPNIDVFPFIVRNANTFGWDIASQTAINASGVLGSIVSPKMQMSSLTASVIQSVCSSLDIATVGFSYRWLDGDGFVAGKTEAFNVSMFGLMVPRQPNATKMVVDRMKMMLDYQLFDIIHTVCGEFEMNVLCDMAGT
ncbi:MAG: hypothetical protein J5614_10175, partial [Paludibacteraceae bacterium]|nr:hypothetical protein [Paludibacteraceae bacterium]